MATINGVPFRQMLVPSSKYGVKCPYPMKAKKITIHNTDNEMPADNEIRYMISNNNSTSYHVAVDEKEAIQGLPFNRNGWHSGDGANGYGNRNTIAFEICRNYDRTRKTTDLFDPLKKYFDLAVLNTIKVVAQVCVNENIVASFGNIKQHYDWNGKNCPSKIRKDGKWNWLVSSIIAEYNRLKGKPVSKPAATVPSKPAPAKPTPPKTSTYTGGSIVDYLNSIGVDSSAANRRKLAKEYGVSNYDLSADKNLELLNKMRAGKQVTKPASKPTTSSKPAAKKQTVHLPANAKTWRAYKLGVQPIKKNSDWSLTPAAFGGLTYDILDRPYQNVVTINTSRGKRNIYVGPETGAVIK